MAMVAAAEMLSSADVGRRLNLRPREVEELIALHFLIAPSIVAGLEMYTEQSVARVTPEQISMAKEVAAQVDVIRRAGRWGMRD